MQDGFGYGTIGIVALATTGLGFLIGDNRGQKKAGKRWHVAMQKCAATGLPTGSDLNEAERKSLFGVLKQHADDLGVSPAMAVTERMALAAKDLLGKTGVAQFVSGEKNDAKALLTEIEGPPVLSEELTADRLAAEALKGGEVAAS